MYNERTNFSLKNVIIQFLFLALLIFILIWLFPLKSDLNGLNGDNKLNVIVDRIFNENIIAMKDAAKSYYTTPRLPKNVGDKVKMTLGEMLDKKIILPFADKNGDACSLTDSYVEITKYDEEFVMKVNLKCGEEENYLLVYMGCYDYCTTAICEKDQNDVKAPVIYTGKDKVIIKEETKTPVINNIINNIINIVTPEQKPDPTPTPKPDEKYYCSIVNGKYYDAHGNIVNEAAYKKSCEQTEEEKYYCKIVNGKYYDANGNIVNEAAYKKSCEQVIDPDPEYLYEYKKVTKGVCTESNWSDWTTTPATASANVSVKTKTVTTNQLIGYNVKTAKDYSKPIYGTKEVETGAYETKKVCTAYGYVPTGEYSYSEYKYVGDVYLDYSPKDTNTVKYIAVSISPWECDKNCSAGITHKYQKWERTAIPITKYQCTKWEKKSVPIKTTVKYITGYETKVISKEPVYKKVTTKYYSTKTRSCTSSTTDIKWSVYNDTALLNNGYVYTGNTKQK